MELFIAVDQDGRVTAYNGHVDLGTGIGTALGQIVAEELDVAFEQVTVVLGHSALVPNQGATIASETIQVTAIPLRRAAAQARHHLVALAAVELDVAPDELEVMDGVVRCGRRNEQRQYGDLLRGRHIRLTLDDATPVKPVEHYRVVGQRVPRADIPAKADGSFTYVHDVRVPGMLHGRVVRPPYAGLDHGPFVGRSLVSVDQASVAHIPGLVAVVTLGDFVGVVAEREENAALAADTLVVHWRGWDRPPGLNAPEGAIRANPATARRLLDRGDLDAALASAATPMRRSYVWPYQLHGSIGPSCAVADVRPDGVTLWSGTQNPLMMRTDVARLLGVPEASVAVLRHEAAGCYGRNCADDVGADAVLLSRACGRPVRVQLTRAQEHVWEPKGAGQVMDVAGGLTAEGAPAGYGFETRYPSNGAPTLALLLTGIVAPDPQVFAMGDRTAVPPYRYADARVTVHDMPPIVRASWFRGVSALPNSFAHESFIDELATEAGVDPIEYRLRHLDDPRAADMIRAVAERAGWQPHTVPQTMAPDGDWLRGRGFAYALYVHGTFPGTAAAWSAWVADVAVNRITGEVAVERVVVGQDQGAVVNPAGVEHQIHGNVLQSTGRVLAERVEFDDGGVASRDWGSYPILSFAQVPAIDVVSMPRPHDPPLGVGESAAVPSAAAIANAIFDATGIRFRAPPFTADVVRAALQGLPSPVPAAAVAAGKPRRILPGVTLARGLAGQG
ncbi:molybdopterin cofactor-binding domain-containing protein, partial [Lichenihabitans sp. Uapishka_5]|uniref:xanthine dehydrogenase family protein molybdopterin-binding subunit n=1 Tax=Lichenihabitans sp. Uapishka_5 TaxID=3037302 RepID=UPI003FA52B51